MSGTTSVRYLSPGEERHHHNITIVPTCDVETKNWWFQGLSRILELFRHRIRAKYWALVIMVKLICKCMQALVMTSVRYLSPEEEISHHNITIVQTWVETKKLMVALPSSSPCPQICHPWSGPISKETSANKRLIWWLVTNQRPGACSPISFCDNLRSVLMNVYTWQPWELTHSPMNEAKDWAGYLFLLAWIGALGMPICVQLSVCLPVYV